MNVAMDALEAAPIPSIVVVCDPEQKNLSRILEMVGPDRPVDVRIYAEGPSHPPGRNKLSSIFLSARTTDTLFLQHSLLQRGSALAARAIIATACNPEWRGQKIIFDADYQDVTARDEGVGG